ncbi:hypothetical protein PTKIN_Ptkin13bG0236300 [Pterospermum kingtungense]
MSNNISFVKDKKKKIVSPSKKLWKTIVSTFHSKLNPLRKSQSRKTSCRLTGTISCPDHHHHHQCQTMINNYHHHHHHYYHPRPNHDQKHIDAEKCLLVDDKACAKPCSEVVPCNTTYRGQQIEPEIEFFDDEGMEMESGSGAIVSAVSGDSGYITFSKLQLLGVDAKAEEFINQRKEAWRLEKQESDEEYWQMLSRGT